MPINEVVRDFVLKNVCAKISLKSIQVFGRFARSSNKPDPLSLITDYNLRPHHNQEHYYNNVTTMKTGIYIVGKFLMLPIRKYLLWTTTKRPCPQVQHCYYVLKWVNVMLVNQVNCNLRSALISSLSRPITDISTHKLVSKQYVYCFLVYLKIIVLFKNIYYPRHLNSSVLLHTNAMLGFWPNYFRVMLKVKQINTYEWIDRIWFITNKIWQ